MVSRTNVNDPNFLWDWIYNADYKRDANADEEANRDLMRDLYGTDAVIFSGLVVGDGSKPDTFRIAAGRARNQDKYHVVLPTDLDNQDSTADSDVYYVAIKHKYETSEPGTPAKDTTAAAYDRVRADGYEIGIDTTSYDEGVGWVLLAVATLGSAGWEYDNLDEYGISTRSRQAVRDAVFWTFTKGGEVTADKPIFMTHHGVSSNVFPGPFEVVINRISITAHTPSGGDVTVTATAAVGDGTLQVTLPATQTDTEVAYDPLGQVVAADEKVQVTISRADVVGAGPEDVAVVLSGYRTGEIR
ncbi:MAG: hypothetical protein V3W11_06365 [bacterium]